MSLANRRANIERAASYLEGKAFLNAESRGHVLLFHVIDTADKAFSSLSDDPALAACQIRDALPPLYNLLTQLNTWSHAVNEASPDDIPTQGARICHS